MKKAGSILLGTAVMAAGFLLGIQPSLAGTLLFDRGLPTANLNNAAGSNRSNVAWADSESSTTPSEYWLPGDNFALSTNATVNDIRVWTIGDSAPTGLSLLGGDQGGAISTISNTYTSQSVTYAGGSTYQGSSGSYLNIYQLDFSVNLNLAANQTFDFFLNGPWSYDSTASTYTNAFLLASNAPLSGSPQQGADGVFLWLDVNTGAGTQTVETWYSGAGGGSSGFGPAWDKNSDGNVQVFGTVPEPPTALLFGFGLAAMVAWGLKSRKARTIQ